MSRVPLSNPNYHIELGLTNKPIDCAKLNFYDLNLFHLKKTWVTTPCSGIFIFHFKGKLCSSHTSQPQSHLIEPIEGFSQQVQPPRSIFVSYHHQSFPTTFSFFKPTTQRDLPNLVSSQVGSCVLFFTRNLGFLKLFTPTFEG